MEAMEALQELEQFLDEKYRLDVKNEALQHVLGVTGTPEGRLLLKKSLGILSRLLGLCADWSCESIAKDACLAIVNLSADEELVSVILDQGAMKTLLHCVLNEDSPVADPACMATCNLTRDERNCELAWRQLQAEGEGMVDRLVAAFSNLKHNQKGATLHYLAPLFSNLSQLPDMRRYLLEQERCVVQRLLPFTQFEGSNVRRGGIIGTLRNCCFEAESHSWLLGPKVDLLPSLLLPLAGPETYPEEEMERLPPDLQYLGEEKRREIDPDLRRMLLEAISQLCANRPARETVRDMGTYLVLRELHKWEEDRATLLACENLVDLLIRTEDEIGVADLKEIDVPQDLTEKFHSMDQQFLNPDAS